MRLTQSTSSVYDNSKSDSRPRSYYSTYNKHVELNFTGSENIGGVEVSQSLEVRISEQAARDLLESLTKLFADIDAKKSE